MLYSSQIARPILCVLLACAFASRSARAQDSAASLPAAPGAQVSQSAQSSPTNSAPAQSSDQNPGPPQDWRQVWDPAEADKVTLFPHTETDGYWISAQANVVFQWHPSFPAKYTGKNSMTPQGQSATTHVVTVYTGWEVTSSAELFADFEYATGGGVGRAFGLAGYTNLDSVRTVSGAQLSTTPYLARLMLRQIIPLSSETTDEDRDEFHLATKVPVRRIEFRLGKFDLADFFDLNTWGQDSHLQFLNWTVDNNGAYDYAANTRGYTDGAIVEYDDHWFAARFAVTMEPKAANGINLDADIARARSENLELQASGKLIAHRSGTVRMLSYVNEADMGNYKQAIAEFEDHETATPNIIDTRRQGRHRYGFGLNFEQSITDDIGVFGRLGWSDGHNESWAYTEDDRELELGGFSMGKPWHRKNDRAGVAFVANGITADHQHYLALGGLGFLLGDGALTYGPEKIFEAFYTTHIWRGFFASADVQHINNPAYNQARGPITVPGLRLHVDF
jgi:high affinity Mn2+ porin